MGKKVVFVHGFVGGKNTWGKFPDLIKNEMNLDCDVSEYGFSTFYFPFVGKSTTVQNLAEGLLTEIKARVALETDEIILVGHSLGGLIIRQMLLNLELKDIKHKIRKIAFFAVPHDGSCFANIVKALPWFRCNKLRALSKDGSFVETLNDQWSYAKLNDKFEILSVIGGQDAVVNSNSAKGIFRHQSIETNIDAGHADIVKPKDGNDLSFILLKQFIDSKRRLKTYRNSCSEDYRGWQLHDNERRHGYRFIADSARQKSYESLCQALDESGSIVRITGLSGLGKSRLIIEYFENNGELEEDDVLAFDGSKNEDEIKSTIKAAIKGNAVGLAIIEGCSIDVHDYLSREIAGQECGLRIITVNFYEEKVDTSPHIHLTELDDNSVTQLISPVLTQFDEGQIKRIVGFVEGFPLLGILIAERFRSEGVLSPELSERDLAQKLIDADNNLSEEHKRILQVCSLFDVFGVELDGIEDADFIIGLARTNRHEFGLVINQFQEKRIINRVGRFARVVPKPLAVHLASMWWENNIHDELQKLIENLPERLIGSFCVQVKYLDSSKKVKEFVETLCDKCSPFGQAELLLSVKGSKLFRALVEVNPQATNDLIFRVIESLEDSDVLSIKADSRRNIVWSLEMLAFHDSCFDKSAWTLFKLAKNETESFSNNATGMFEQLFRCRLSGTEANFDRRLGLLKKLVSLDDEKSDLVAIAAINSGIDTYGGSRTVGAEFQGTKPELIEWKPSTYGEIFSYWQNLVDILLTLADKEALVEQVKDALGHQIRSLISYDRVEMLDKAINSIINKTGKYWPAAVESISSALNYDSESLNDNQQNALVSWQELLKPSSESTEEKLKLIVLNPARDLFKSEDGHYIDCAAEEAKILAKEFSSAPSELIEHFDTLFNFSEQKQSWVFGKELMLNLSDPQSFLEHLFNYLRGRDVKSCQFASGIFYGLNELDSELWKNYISIVGKDSGLHKYYPDLVRTGQFTIDDLKVLVDLIKTGILESQTAVILAYGSVTSHLNEHEISQFCLELSSVDPTAKWVALDCLNMFMFGNKEYEFLKVKESLTSLVLSVSFAKKDKSRHSDSYHWLTSVEKLLDTKDLSFAINLCEYLLIQVEKNDIDYSDLWDCLNKAFYKAFELHRADLWNAISPQILDIALKGSYRLKDLLVSKRSFESKSNSIFCLIDTALLIEWCKAERALFLVARSIPVFTNLDDKKVVTPLLVEMLAHYGNDKIFLDEISANFHTRGWTGSLIPYLESDHQAISAVKHHEHPTVVGWAVNMCEKIEKAIAAEAKKEAEEAMLRNH